MGNRLSKIATRTGDDGTTGLGDGRRIGKDDTRIAAIGDVDELNSNLGVLLAETLPDEIRTALVTIQHDLFDLGGELCIPGHTVLDDTHLARLDRWLADYNATLPPLKEFILPAGSRAASRHCLQRASLRCTTMITGYFWPWSSSTCATTVSVAGSESSYTLTCSFRRYVTPVQFDVRPSSPTLH